MFSLIITIISIALVAALALATLYYGGDAFNQGASRVNAARVINQGQQLLGASELYYIQTGAWPANIQALMDGGYLKAAPVAQGSTAPAFADTQPWAMPAAGQPVFVLTGTAVDVCRSINRTALGADGILAQAHTTLAAQCFSPAEKEYIVLVSKNEGAVLAAAAQDAPLLRAAQVSTSAAPPATEVSARWAELPEWGGGADLATASGVLTGSGVLTIPARASSVTLTGQGGTGGDDSWSNPGQPYIAPTYVSVMTDPGQAAVAPTYSNVMTNPGQAYVAPTYSSVMTDPGRAYVAPTYSTSTVMTNPGQPYIAGYWQDPWGGRPNSCDPASGDCDWVPGQPYIAPTYSTVTTMTSPGRAYIAPTYSNVMTDPGRAYVAPTYSNVMTSPGQAYVAPTYSNVMTDPGQAYVAPTSGGGLFTGPSTSAELNGATATWAGGLGGPATETTQTLVSGGTRTLSYTVAPGGTLSYSYRY